MKKRKKERKKQECQLVEEVFFSIYISILFKTNDIEKLSLDEPDAIRFVFIDELRKTIFSSYTPGLFLPIVQD